MPRVVRCGLIQAVCTTPVEESLETIKRAAVEKHLRLIEQAAGKGVKILCMQEIFTGPYFCAEQSTRWYGMVEKIPDGPTVQLMREVAKQYGAYRENDGISERAIFVVDKEGNLAYKDIHNIADQPDNEDLFEVLRKL